MSKTIKAWKSLVSILHPSTVKSGKLPKYDQIVVYLAMKIFHESPGMTGLCISAAYSATLSTLSTGLNSFATVAFKVNFWRFFLHNQKKNSEFQNQFNSVRDQKRIFKWRLNQVSKNIYVLLWIRYCFICIQFDVFTWHYRWIRNGISKKASTYVIRLWY